MRASSETYQREKGKDRVVLSHDGYNAYCLITDAFSRHTWCFPTTSKEPPISILDMFLTRHGLHDTDTPRSIRVDQGGEFARSNEFRKIAAKHGYVVEPTGSDTPSQNGRVERLNQTFGIMVRSLLYSAGLPPRFWSDALLHAVYLKNRLWHSAIKRTPYEAYLNTKPDLSQLRVFGSLVTSRVSGERPAKLDRHTFRGVFLGYTATDLNVRYYDLTSGRIKIARHVVFDEAHYMSQTRPPGPQFLYDLGIEDLSDLTPPPPDVPHLTPHAPLPPMAPNTPITVPVSALTTALPYREHAAPRAAAATVRQPVITSLPDRDAIASLEFSCDPFGPSFDERRRCSPALLRPAQQHSEPHRRDTRDSRRDPRRASTAEGTQTHATDTP